MKNKLIMLFIILITINIWSCDMEPIAPDPPYMVMQYPDADNIDVIDHVNVIVYNLTERYYDISFILEGRDDTRERNVVYQDTFLYSVDMMNKKTGGQFSFAIQINDLKEYGIVHAKPLNEKIVEFKPEN